MEVEIPTHFMECDKLSDIAAVRIALDICKSPEIKKEILCAPGSDYDGNKKSYKYDRKKQWDEIIEKKVTVLLSNTDLKKHLYEKVIGVVLLMGMRMLTWAEYHEGNLGFSREYSVNFLNSSFFTPQGIIDNKKAAEELMKDGSLDIEQKYKLACLYCFSEHIDTLYRQLKNEDKKKFYNAKKPQLIRQPGLVKFWSYYLMGEINKLRGRKSADLYRLEKAVESGSKAAIEYCLEKTNLRRKKDVIVDAALETVRIKTVIGDEDDWVVFGDERYKGDDESWVPSDYYIDSVYYLLSKMKEDQQIEFLKKDIEGVNYENDTFRNHKHSRVLEYLLNWPYQSSFMKTAELTWEFLPESSYADLLLEICNKIEPKEDENLKHAEGKSYDYRELLEEFWCKSPERYKRYVLNDNEITNEYGSKETLKKGKELLVKLLSLKNFTYQDRKIIELILADATEKEKRNIISSEEGRNICFGLMKDKRWEILDEFIRNTVPSKEKADEIRRDLSCTKEMKLVCFDYIKNDKLDSVESLIEWSTLPEEEINKLKKGIIYSQDGRDACVSLISQDKKVEAVDEFIRWCLPSEVEVKAFKKKLVTSHEGICKCVDLVIEKQLELADEFIHFGLSSEDEVEAFKKKVVTSYEAVCKCVDLVAEEQLDRVDEFINFGRPSEEEIKELKKNVAYRIGRSVCERLISDYSEEDVYDEQGDSPVGSTIKFTGGRWEEVEKFLNWCFSSEEEINEFKRKVLFMESGKEIQFKLIKTNQWEEAERFFAWLDLSAKEIKELKKETLYYYDEVYGIFSKLIYKDDDEEFVDYASKQGEIELLLERYLRNKQTILEFKEEFKSNYQDIKDEAVFKNFDRKIDQCLRDLKCTKE